MTEVLHRTAGNAKSKIQNREAEGNEEGRRHLTGESRENGEDKRITRQKDGGKNMRNGPTNGKFNQGDEGQNHK
jgi:hypothetical protein